MMNRIVYGDNMKEKLERVDKDMKVEKVEKTEKVEKVEKVSGEQIRKQLSKFKYEMEVLQKSIKEQ